MLLSAVVGLQKARLNAGGPGSGPRPGFGATLHQHGFAHRAIARGGGGWAYHRDKPQHDVSYDSKGNWEHHKDDMHVKSGTGVDSLHEHLSSYFRGK